MRTVDLIVLAFGLGIFFIEILLLKRRGKTVQLQPSILNLSLGMLERLIGILSLNLGLHIFQALVPYQIIPSVQNSILAFVLAFVVTDLFWYIYHRASHRVSVAWVAHLIHHQPVEYNMSVNFAMSPYGQILRVFLYAPMVLLGITPENIVLATVVHALYQALLHSELWPEFKGLERVVVTPRYHQIHHSCANDHLDKNYGGFLTIWDQLFGSYHTGREPLTYGLTKPIEQPDPIYVSVFFAARLLQNFREMPFSQATKLLFVGPEKQPKKIPRLYRHPVNPTWGNSLAGFTLFLTGYILTSHPEIMPFWLAFTLALVGSFWTSGLQLKPILLTISRR
jgi:sterol desaturase/sphingolipid hydroxylase (fatty acid hydroxylase superfamily)